MDPIVELDSGLARGVVEKHEDGFNYYAFKSIPYAEPPIGELRFQDPVPKKQWTGVLDCKNYGPVCFQQHLFTQSESYNENCVNLNVFSHSINKPNANIPVMVWIHEGEFSFGSANDFFHGPDYLIRKKIVLVTVNYRLGVIGFLNLEDEVASGNQGLKDQVMALKWINRNIRVFGGDPSNVTVCGITAGAVSAQYLALSPLTKGLIHKLIIHSNVIQNPGFTQYNPKSIAIKLCSLLGKKLTDSKEILKFLKTIDSKQLLEAQKRLLDSVDGLAFGPGIDNKSANPLMPIHPNIAADQGIHLPCLVGYTRREGVAIHISRQDFFRLCNLDFSRMFLLHSEQILKRYKLTAKQVKRLYYKNEEISDNNLDAFVDLQGDLQFIEGIHKFVRVQAERSSASTYLFQFSYDAPDSLSKAILKDVSNGACHLDDSRYLFKQDIFEYLGLENLKKGTKSYRIMEQMTEMWTNFVTHGRPTVDTSDLIPVHWQPIIDGTLLRYMNIDEDTTMQSTLNVDQKFLSAARIKV